MKTLIVGAGALGGVIAARLSAAGVPVALATRTSEAADDIRRAGLNVTGMGGDVAIRVHEVAPLEHYSLPRQFDLIVLATKAHDAIAIAPNLLPMLATGGTLLPIQNGGVPQTLAGEFGDEFVLGGLSTLGATMVRPGVYEQRNNGHLLIGELRGGESDRCQRAQQWFGASLSVRTSSNMLGAVWSKLLVNCSVTTLGAVAGTTMRDYIQHPDGRALFDRVYEETLAVVLASGIRPERLLVDPIPPARDATDGDNHSYKAWIEDVLRGYGDLKPSMLQDIQRGRATEIDFINGYVADTGRRFQLKTPINNAIVDTIRAISRGGMNPHISLLSTLRCLAAEELNVSSAGVMPVKATLISRRDSQC